MLCVFSGTRFQGFSRKSRVSGPLELRCPCSEGGVALEGLREASHVSVPPVLKPVPATHADFKCRRHCGELLAECTSSQVLPGISDVLV